MNKNFIKGLVTGLSAALLVVMISNKKIHCECCGELFNNNHTFKKDICDICFGFHECKGKYEKDYKLELKNNTYYFN
jgi:hypothetical protein